MSDEKPKPYVFYTADDTGAADDGWSIVIGGVRIPTRFRDDDPDVGAAVERAAEAVARAVEAREAKLRGLLLKVSEALCFWDFDGVGQCIGCEIRFDLTTSNPAVYQQHIEECLQGRALHEIAELMHHERGPDYVHGDVACGLAFDLGAARDRLESSWGVLLDRCSQAGTFTYEEFVRASAQCGIAPLMSPARAASDGELIAEFQHRVLQAPEPGDVVVRRSTVLPPPHWRRVNQGIPSRPGDTPENPLPVTVSPDTTIRLPPGVRFAQIRVEVTSGASPHSLGGAMDLPLPAPRATASPPPPSPDTDTSE